MAMISSGAQAQMAALLVAFVFGMIFYWLTEAARRFLARRRARKEYETVHANGDHPLRMLCGRMPPCFGARQDQTHLITCKKCKALLSQKGFK